MNRSRRAESFSCNIYFLNWRWKRNTKQIPRKSLNNMVLNAKKRFKCFAKNDKIIKKYGIERQCHLDSTYRSIFQDFKMWQRNLRDNEFSSSFLRAKPKKTKSPRDADFVCRCEALDCLFQKFLCVLPLLWSIGVSFWDSKGIFLLKY